MPNSNPAQDSIDFSEIAKNFVEYGGVLGNHISGYEQSLKSLVINPNIVPGSVTSNALFGHPEVEGLAG